MTQVRKGDVLICINGNDDAIEGEEYVAMKDFVIPSNTETCPTVMVLDSKGQDVGGVFPWRFKLKEDNMSQKTINVGDTLVVLRGKGTPNLPDGAEVNVLNVSGGNTSVQVLNTSGRKEWYGLERFKLQTAAAKPESMIGKTMVVTSGFNPLKIGDTFVVVDESTSYWRYKHDGRSGLLYHPKTDCKLQEETAPVVRKLANYGRTLFEVGDKARITRTGVEIVVTKVYNHADTNQTVYYGDHNSTDNSSVELIQQETNMTQSRTPTTKNPSGAIAGDTVLVEGVLTRGPDGDNEFVIKLGTKDAFVPAQAIKQITKKVVIGPKFAVGSAVKMNSAKIAYTDTRKRGKVLFEKSGVYFIEWTGGELGSGTETNSIKEQSLLAA